MAKQTINLGTSANKGNGDPLRTAFSKVNSNFDELYALTGGTAAELEEIAQDYAAAMLDHDNHTNVTVAYDDASNQLVLSTTNHVENVSELVNDANYITSIAGTVTGSLLPDTDVTYDLGSATNRFRDLYLSGSTIDLGGTTLSIVGGQLQIDGTDIADVVAAQGANPFDQDLNTTDDVVFNTVSTPNLVLDGDVTTSNELFIDGDAQAIGIKSQVEIVLDGDVNFQNGDLNVSGDINFSDSTGTITGDTIVLLPTSTVDIGNTRLLENITPVDVQGGSVGTASLPFGDAHFYNTTVSNTLTANVINATTLTGDIENTSVSITSTDTDIDITSADDINIDAADNINVNAANGIYLDAVNTIGLASQGSLEIISGTGIDALEAAYTAQSAVVDALLTAGDYGGDLVAPSDYTFYDLVVARRAINPLIPQELEDEALAQLNAYNAWQTALTDRVVYVSSYDKLWEFKTDGSLVVPGNIEFDVGSINNSVSDGGGLQVETTSDFEIKVDTAIWSFEPNDGGRIEFPDGSTQTTAYTGPQTSFTGNISIGEISSGETDIYGNVEFNDGTTAFQPGNSVSFNCDVDFNDVVKFGKTTTTGADDNPTLTLIDVNSSGVQVLTSNDNNTNNWELPDGSEGQVMHFVAGGAGGSGANHKIKINNWWKRDGDTGVWSSGSGYWDVFAIYGFAGRTDTGMATAIFVDGAWRTTSPWVD